MRFVGALVYVSAHWGHNKKLLIINILFQKKNTF